MKKKRIKEGECTKHSGGNEREDVQKAREGEKRVMQK